MSAPLSRFAYVVVPRRLFEKLSDNKRFEKMTELRGGRRIKLCEFGGRESHHVRPEPRVDDVQLGSLADPRTQRAAPRRQSANEEKVGQ